MASLIPEGIDVSKRHDLPLVTYLLILQRTNVGNHLVRDYQTAEAQLLAVARQPVAAGVSDIATEKATSG